MRSSLLILCILIIASAVCHAQAAPEEGGHELQIWAGGGHSVPGGTKNTGAFNAGLRYGWILTGPHLPWISPRTLRNMPWTPCPCSSSSSPQIPPSALVSTRLRPGSGIFQRHGRLSPFLELCGGTLFTNHNVPTGTNTVNFTDQAALGVHLLGAKHNVSLELRYMHISNAGLATPNPGINTVLVRLGVGEFFNRPKR